MENEEMIKVLEEELRKAHEKLDRIEQELKQEQILGETRKKNIVDVPMDKQLEDTRQNKKITINIEALLNDEDEDNFGHQFSDDDLKKFADELGLDYIMESKREEYDDVV